MLTTVFVTHVTPFCANIAGVVMMLVVGGALLVWIMGQKTHGTRSALIADFSAWYKMIAPFCSRSSASQRLH